MLNFTCNINETIEKLCFAATLIPFSMIFPERINAPHLLVDPVGPLVPKWILFWSVWEEKCREFHVENYLLNSWIKEGKDYINIYI